MKREISATGIINAEGGLAMYMGEVNAFFAQHKGERVFVRFMVAPRATSKAMIGYYYHYIVPTIRAALWETGDRKTEQQVEQFLREISPICYAEDWNIENTEKTFRVQCNTRLREISELDNTQLAEHIDTIRQFAAEELGVFVDDPKTL